MRMTVTVLVVAALAVGSCGGSGDDGPTRADFIAKTDARCKVSNARTKALNAEVSRVADTAPTEARLLRGLAPILERAFRQVRDNATAFRAVTAPSADAAEVGRIRALYDEQAAVVGKLSQAAKNNDLKQYRTLFEEQKDVLVRLRKATGAYGLKECGSTKSDAA